MPSMWLDRGVRLLLLLVPLLVADLISESAVQSRFDQRQQAFVDDLSARVERIAVRLDAPTVTRQVLLALLTSARRAGPRGLAVDDLDRYVGQRFPGLELDIYQFAGDHRLRAVWPRQATNQYLISQIYAGVTTTDIARRDRLRNQTGKMISKAFGMGKTLNTFLANPTRLIPVKTPRGDATVVWQNGPGWGVFAVLSALPREAHRLARAARAEGFRRRHRVTFAYTSGQTGQWRVVGTARGSVSGETELPVMAQRAHADGVESVTTPERIFVFRQTREGQTVAAGVPRPPHLAPPRFALLRGLFAGTGLLAAAFLVLRRDRLGPIRRLAPTLFLVAALVPIGGMVLGSLILIENRREVLANEVWRFGLENLQQMDDQFVAFQTAVRNWLTRATAAPTLAAAGPVAEKELQRIYKSGMGAQAQLLDPQGRVLSGTPPHAWPLQNIMSLFVPMAITDYAPKRVHQLSRRRSGAGDAFFTDSSSGLGYLAEQPHILHPIATDMARKLFFWSSFPAPEHKAALIAILLDRDRMVERYWQRTARRRLDLWNTQWRFAAYDHQQVQWQPHLFTQQRRLSALAQRANVMNRPRLTRARIDGNEYWCVCRPAARLAPFTLVGLFPVSALDAQLAPLQWAIGAGLAAALALALALGGLFSRHLLVPLADLARGLECLRRNDFRNTLPVRARDELGDLATGFNAMTEELRELNVANAVQASLTPSEFPQPTGYVIHGQVRFAGDLGGDCLDCRKLPDGRIVFVVGDVSGHGAASALVMAAVKAAISLWSRQAHAPIETLARRIDALLHSRRGQRTFVAAFLATLDPDGHALEYVTCGHPFPMLRQRDGEVVLLGRPTYPLGSRRVPTAPTGARVAIPPGATLLIYTDGLVEAVDREGTVWGYAGLQDWLIQRPPAHLTPTVLIDRLLAHHDARSMSNDDDITLLVVHRPEPAHD